MCVLFEWKEKISFAYENFEIGIKVWISIAKSAHNN